MSLHLRAYAPRAIPFVLGILIALWALRGVGANNIIDTDAARHAMNGAFVHDLVSSGHILHPLEYGKHYYGRLPALSMPFHPPLFPTIESLFFGMLGVNVLAARLAVALGIVVFVVVWYRLILATHRSHSLAICAVITFCFWFPSQVVAGDVMLEFPALAFTVGALWWLRDLDREYPLRRAILFALFAGAAVWVKQHAIFLGLVPFFYIAISRRWRLLAGKALWISSALFGLQVMALWLLTRPFNHTGADQVPPATEIADTFVRNLAYYFHVVRSYAGAAGAAIVAVTFVLAIFDAWNARRIPGRCLHAAWAASCLLVLLWIGPYEPRYLMFGLGGFIIIAYHALERVATVFLAQSRAWVVPAVLTAILAVPGLTMPEPFLRGPAEAASLVLQHRPKRVLYCGTTDGNFMFAVRSLDREMRTIVVSGDKLPQQVFTPDAFEKFAHQYGIEYVILEEPMVNTPPYEFLLGHPSRSMMLDTEIRMDSYPPRWRNHRLKVYRFTNPSPRPDSTLLLNVNKLGAAMEFTL